MKWVLAEHDAGRAEALAREAGIHPLIARLMVVRGITDAAAARSFLSGGLASLSDPRIFLGMTPAVERIRRALAVRERIVIYGDYDVDGVTGAALLYLALRELGADAGWYIPDRLTEGYGLNAEALQKLKAGGAGLIITVDCGISASREAELARSLGIGLIITDHHESASVHCNPGCPPGSPTLPVADAVLHPRLLQPDVPAAIREGVSCLTGVGVSYKLVQGLLECRADDPRLTRHLDLVTLGTVADMGRISGENRVLVKEGLEMLCADAGLRPGVAALKEVAGLAGKRVTAGTVGFSLAPRINASGRIESADTAFRLLITDSQDEARELASVLDSVNRERRAVEEAAWEDARERCRREDIAGTGALVLASTEWHPGVVGIVASRIAEEFYRPTALIALKDGVGKGSARSIPGFDLYQGLSACSDLLLGFGGHKYAAGLSVAEEAIPLLRERLSGVVLEQMGGDGFVRTITIDAPLSFEELTFDLLRDIERMAPFGQGNPEPRLGAKGLESSAPRVVGNNHLKFRLRQRNGAFFDAIAFNRGDRMARWCAAGSSLAAVFTPRVNTWNGTSNIELEIRDIKIENSKSQIPNSR